ncbi:YolD-like family protein [Paenibacillus sp. FSL K6-2859]|uniref:YolD-like family protein n=1 Tax=Paenibacillus sp. FSL K6-2859 TaxID=2921482 RepID=UPI0030F7B359
MRKKLEGNGLWESSRMIMPEHERRIIADQRNQEIRYKPELDPQAWDEINEVVAKSIEDHSAITLTMFDPNENIVIEGIATRIDKQLNQIKMRWPNDDYDWIKIDKIISTSV